jgi:hypothetical protein
MFPAASAAYDLNMSGHVTLEDLPFPVEVIGDGKGRVVVVEVEGDGKDVTDFLRVNVVPQNYDTTFLRLRPRKDALVRPAGADEGSSLGRRLGRRRRISVPPPAVEKLTIHVPPGTTFITAKDCAELTVRDVTRHVTVDQQGAGAVDVDSTGPVVVRAGKDSSGRVDVHSSSSVAVGAMGKGLVRLHDEVNGEVLLTGKHTGTIEVDGVTTRAVVRASGQSVVTFRAATAAFEPTVGGDAEVRLYASGLVYRADGPSSLSPPTPGPGPGLGM